MRDLINMPFVLDFVKYIIVIIVFASFANVLTESLDVRQGQSSCNDTSVPNYQSTQDDILKYLTASCRYNHFKRAQSLHSGPLTVTARVYIYFLKAAKGSSAKFSAQMLLHLEWKDPRLRFDNLKVSFTVLHGEKYLMDSIWMPYVYLPNEKESLVMGYLRKDDFIAIHSDGNIHYTTRLKANANCHLELGKFPFDVQSCSLILETLKYNSSEVILEWQEPNSVHIQGGKVNLTEFELLSLTTTKKVEQQVSAPDFKKYNYSSLVLTFVLAREYGFYIMDYYIPSVLLVVLSWVSFWLTPDALPARINLGSSTMLTFLQLGWSSAKMPKVSQFQSNNIWAVGCTLFIFLSLVEFAFVNTIDRAGNHDVELKKPTSKYILKSTLSTPQKPKIRVRRPSSCPSSPEMKRHFASQPLKPRHKVIEELSESEFSMKLKNRLETVAEDRQNEENQLDVVKKHGYTSGMLRHRKVSIRPPQQYSAEEKKPEKNLAGLSEMEKVKNQLRRDSVILNMEEVKIELKSMQEKYHRKQSILHQVPVFTMTNKEIAKWIDEKSRIVFPTSFLIFCLFYWSFLWI